MASANRLIELRHPWLRSRRMAEISVPACPIPIHQTKLVIAKPQATGMFTPQMPTPLAIRYDVDTRKMPSMMTPALKHKYQNSGEGFVRTIDEICSVMP